MTEILTVATSLAALGLGVGIFILPDPRRALLCFMGLSLAVAAFLLSTDSYSVAWGVLFAGTSICATYLSGPPSTERGWQNWFVIVVTASTIWLLSLFLLWTLEEALVLPVGIASIPALGPDVLRMSFVRFGWPVGLVGLMLLAVAVSATHGTQEAEDGGGR